MGEYSGVRGRSGRVGGVHGDIDESGDELRPSQVQGGAGGSGDQSVGENAVPRVLYSVCDHGATQRSEQFVAPGIM